MSHRERHTPNSHLEEWAALLGADIADDSPATDAVESQDDRA